MISSCLWTLIEFTENLLGISLPPDYTNVTTKPAIKEPALCLDEFDILSTSHVMSADNKHTKNQLEEFDSLNEFLDLPHKPLIDIDDL